MMTSTTRPLAVVTGASSGIGADLARELARDGYDLVLTARTLAPMQALAAELDARGASSVILPADLSRPGAAAELASTIEARGLSVDVLVNNAGLGAIGRFDQIDPGRVSEMLQVNVVALTELTRMLLPGMVARRRGRVMLVASTASFQPGPRMAVYFATKAYVLSLGDDDERGRGCAHRLSRLEGRPPSGDHRRAQQHSCDRRQAGAALDHFAGRQRLDVASLTRIRLELVNHTPDLTAAALIRP